MLICPKCFNQNEDGAAQCARCGVAMPKVYGHSSADSDAPITIDQPNGDDQAPDLFALVGNEVGDTAERIGVSEKADEDTLAKMLDGVLDQGSKPVTVSNVEPDSPAVDWFTSEPIQLDEPLDEPGTIIPAEPKQDPEAEDDLAMALLEALSGTEQKGPKSISAPKRAAPSADTSDLLRFPQPEASDDLDSHPSMLHLDDGLDLAPKLAHGSHIELNLETEEPINVDDLFKAEAPLELSDAFEVDAPFGTAESYGAVAAAEDESPPSAEALLKAEELKPPAEVPGDSGILFKPKSSMPFDKADTPGYQQIRDPSSLPYDSNLDSSPTDERGISESKIRTNPRVEAQRRDAMISDAPPRTESPPKSEAIPRSAEPLNRKTAQTPTDKPRTGLNCTQCGSYNPSGMYYCVHCGSSLLKMDSATNQLQKQVICPECQTVNPTDNKFCGNCGAGLSLDEEVPSQSQQPDFDLVKKPTDRQVKLVSINDDGTDGVELSLNYDETIIGRSADTRFPTDAFLSPKHARLSIEENDLHIEDLYSLNGTFLKLRGEVKLKPGDCFLMGRQVLRFERFEQTITPKARSSDGTRYMGSPPPGGRYKVVQVGIGGVVQNVYCLPEAGAVLGRERGDILFGNDKYLSARHAKVFLKDDGNYYLTDLNSSNGTWIRIWEKSPLKDSDFIFLGQQLFRIEIDDPQGAKRLR